MKNLILIITLVFVHNIAFSQFPQGINYQAVLRDKSDNILVNQTVGLKFKIQNASGVIYTETFTVITNAFGLVNLVIGKGTKETGSVEFNTIDWSNPYNIDVFIDIDNNSKFVQIATQPLMSVPYALYALKSGSGSSGGADNWGTQSVAVNATLEGNGTSASPLKLAQQSATNGQVLQWNGTTWLPATISSPGGNDNWGTQIVISNTTLEGNGTSTSPLKLAQQSATNGQVLKWNGSTWLPANDSLGSISSSANWSLNGNSGNSTKFLGTTDSLTINFKLNNVRAGRIEAGYPYPSQNANTAFGFQTLSASFSGDNNTAIGHKSLPLNTSYYNTGVGSMTLLNNTSGYSNSALGVNALQTNTTGKHNTAIGTIAMGSGANVNTGDYNTAVGYGSVKDNSTGTYNTGIGYFALRYNTTGSYNTGVGYQTLGWNLTGTGNTAIGQGALYNSTGDYNTGLGYNADVSGGSTNSTAIGYQTSVSSSNQVRIGNAVTSIGGPQNWTNTSDSRIKTDVKENVPGMSFIKLLRPVTYYKSIKLENEIIGKSNENHNFINSNYEQIRYSGFIAQEVEQASKSINYNFSGVDAPQNKNDLYGLRYAEFVVPIVKGMQEQQTIIEQLQLQIKNLQLEIEKLKATNAQPR